VSRPSAQHGERMGRASAGQPPVLTPSGYRFAMRMGLHQGGVGEPTIFVAAPAVHFMSYHPMIPGPQVAAGAGWDHIGSPEWLDALFPNVHQPPDRSERATRRSSSRRSRRSGHRGHHPYGPSTQNRTA